MQPANPNIMLCRDLLRGLRSLVLAYLCALIANFYGCFLGFAAVGLTLLWRHVDRLPSPDGARVLVSYRRSNARLVYLAAIVVLIWIVRRGEVFLHYNAVEQCRLLFIGVLGASLFLCLPIFLFFSVFAVFWHHSKMVVMENDRIIASCSRLCSLDTAFTNFLWLPAGKALLVADADEHDWHFYLWRLDGPTPVLRPIAFKEDWPWLEPLWREYGVLAEAYLKVPVQHVGKPRDYAEHFRWFFRYLLPQCREFPNKDYRYLKYNYKNRVRQYFSNIGKGVLNNIPDESTAYRRMRWLTERRMELIAVQRHKCRT